MWFRALDLVELSGRWCLLIVNSQCKVEQLITFLQEHASSPQSLSRGTRLALPCLASRPGLNICRFATFCAAIFSFPVHF
mmetsp:Transcript_24451/g.37154  ORF Transcript_24451/g.37154 Transcript_24451/m.37154 type:complete len:80 (+) Transcript_24451:167-406(+)